MSQLPRTHLWRVLSASSSSLSTTNINADTDPSEISYRMWSNKRKKQIKSRKRSKRSKWVLKQSSSSLHPLWNSSFNRVKPTVGATAQHLLTVRSHSLDSVPEGNLDPKGYRAALVALTLPDFHTGITVPTTTSLINNSLQVFTCWPQHWRLFMLRAMTRLWLKVASERRRRATDMESQNYYWAMWKNTCSTKLHEMLFYFSGMQHKS